MAFYVVQRGDTLSSIAAAILGQAGRWTEIASSNGLKNPDLLFVGQKLKVPNAPSGPGQINQRGTAQPIGGLGRTGQGSATLALARGFMFVIFEQLPEVGTRRIVRKVLVVPRDFSLQPVNVLGKLSPAEHALGLGQSQFLSASNRPFGAPNFQGRPLLIDTAKVLHAGGRILPPDEVIRDLERFAAENPASRIRVEKLIGVIRNIEGEVLIEGGVPAQGATKPKSAHVPYIRSAEDLWQEFVSGKIARDELEQSLARLESAYSRARVVGHIGRVLTVAGVVFTAAEVLHAGGRSLNERSLRPLGAETLRQLGGWGGAAAGAKLGFAGGALFGIETGPGAIVTGAIGAIVFGAAGYFGADWIADWVDPRPR